MGFRFVLDKTVRTLSGNGAPASGTISGLLFVPDLKPEDPCNDIVKPFIPSNVTRYKDVSDFGYPILGLAPWVSAECTLSFLAASREASTSALAFFEPASNETGLPPPQDDKCWDLNDNQHWIAQNDYPVFAVPGPAGKTLMNELAWFSDGPSQNNSQNEGNTSPDPLESKTARLFTMIDTGMSHLTSPAVSLIVILIYIVDAPISATPSLWSFVLAILGTIFGLSLVLLVLYRLVQRRRRNILRQRIDEGEVDVEYLAMNQIKVPREIVEKMPLYIYTNTPKPVQPESAKEETETNVEEVPPSSRTPSPTPDEEPSSPPTWRIPTVTGIRRPAAAIINPATDNRVPASQNPYRLSHTQTTCAICLEDFVAGSTTVRELPCGHVFDPGCIDTCLMENSSLCPLCKKSVLPPGSVHIPVTNAMVRQDYAARHAR